MTADPLAKERSEFDAIIARINAESSPVGIDAQLTHAIIIDYLQQISQRLTRIEARLET